MRRGLWMMAEVADFVSIRAEVDAAGDGDTIEMRAVA